MANEQINEQSDQKVVVDAQTFFVLQTAQLDNNIAESELHEAEAALEVARAKKIKTQTILDFNIDQIEKRQALQQQQQQPDKNTAKQSDASRKSKLKN